MTSRSIRHAFFNTLYTQSDVTVNLLNCQGFTHQQLLYSKILHSANKSYDFLFGSQTNGDYFLPKDINLSLIRYHGDGVCFLCSVNWIIQHNSE